MWQATPSPSGMHLSTSVSSSSQLGASRSRSAVRYTSAPGYDGADSFTYEICDDDGACDTALVLVTVDAAAIAPMNATLNTVSCRANT